MDFSLRSPHPLSASGSSPNDNNIKYKPTIYIYIILCMCVCRYRSVQSTRSYPIQLTVFFFFCMPQCHDDVPDIKYSS